MEKSLAEFPGSLEQELTCRFCASVVKSGPEEHGWVKVSEKWFHSAESIDSITRKYFPQGLMVPLPNETSLQHICPSCVSDLQIIKDFIDKIIKGQEKLAQLFQSKNDQQHKGSDVSTHECNFHDTPVKPRKRGRPRKDANAIASKTTTQEMTNVQHREKRTSRPPVRYGREDDSTEELVCPIREPSDDDNRQCEEKPCNANISIQSKFDDLVSLPETCLEVTVGETANNQSDSCIPASNKESNAINCDEAVNLEQLKAGSLNIQDSGTSINTEQIHSNHSVDTNFKLNSFNSRSSPGKRRKRGRPRTRKRNEFKCDQCEKVYAAYASLVYHKLSQHENKQDFNCSLCQKKFAHKSLLANHMFTHSSHRPFVCDEDDCNSSFKSRGSLFNHKKAIHKSNRDKMYTCEICGLQFALKASLNSHHKIHIGAKPFKCEYCDKSFSHRGNLKEHVRTHTKERPYLCGVSECGRSFTTASQLRSHKMRHLVRKPFLCVECGKGFSQRTGLVSHMRSHKGEPLKCQLCNNKEFMDPSALKKHQRVHSGEKPFRCDFCNKAFSDPSNFLKHKKTHPKLNETVKRNESLTGDNIQKSSSIVLPIQPSSETSTALAVPNYMEINGASTSDHLPLDAVPVTETYVQILTSDELATLNAGTSSDDGNIIFLYQPEDLFSVSVEESQAIGVPIESEETVVLQEIKMGELGTIATLSYNSQEETQD